jgi:hypothetical protein
MEMQSDEMSLLLDKNTGKIHLISAEEFQAAEDETSYEEFPEWQRENIATAREILNDEERFINLPSKWDIHEYNIMERFCRSIEDERISLHMLDSIRGKGAFRRFKETLDRFGIREQWFAFREEAFREIAREWCERHSIEYEE